MPPPTTNVQVAWNSLGPPLARRAAGPGQPGERANFNAGERAGAPTLTRESARQQHRWQGELTLCSRTLSKS